MSEKVIEKINWPLWIIVIIIINILANLGTGILGILGQFYGCIYTLGIGYGSFALPTLALILPLLLYPFTYFGKRKVNLETLARLILIGLISSLAIGNFNDNYMSWPVGSAARVYVSIPEVRDAMIKLWWVPPESAVFPAIRIGGVAPDWGAWIPGITYVVLFYLLFFLLNSSLMMIFRHQFIDVEKIPYPVAIAFLEGARHIFGLQEVKRSRTMFLIGMAIGFIVNLQLMLTFIFPWWPDLLAWRGTTTAPGCADDAHPLLDSALVGWVGWNKAFHAYPLAYLCPLSVSFSTWVFYAIFLVLAQIAYYMGYYTGILGAGIGRGKIWWYPWQMSPFWGPPLYWSWLGLTGGAIALVLIVLWYARGHIRNTLNATLKGSPREAGEPFSYRTMYVMFIASCILVIAFLASLQMDTPLWIVVLIFGGLIYPFAEAYIQGLTGAAFAQERSIWPNWPYHFIWPRHPGYSPGFNMATIMMARGVNSPSGGLITWSVASMTGFRVGSLAGMSMRDVYKFLLLSLLIAAPITAAFRVWWPHMLGAKFPMCMSGWECGDCGDIYYNERVPPTEMLAQPVIAGFIITAVLFWLRTRFLWWPLHPVGFLLMASDISISMGMWSQFLVAWIAKWLTLRIGGSKAYEEYGVPCAAGMITGYAGATLLAIILGIYRYFVPF